MRCVLTVLLVCLSISWAPLARAEGRASRRVEAERLYQQGERHLRHGRLRAALAAFRRSVDHTFWGRTAAKLGRLELELGLYEDAAADLETALVYYDSRRELLFVGGARHPVEEDDAEWRRLNLIIETLEESQAVALEHVVTVATSCNVKNFITAKLYVDGVERGLCDERLFLAPGAHLLETRGILYRTERRAVDGEAGERIAVHFDLPIDDPAPAEEWTLSLAPVAPLLLGGVGMVSSAFALDENVPDPTKVSVVASGAMLFSSGVAYGILALGMLAIADNGLRQEVSAHPLGISF